MEDERREAVNKLERQRKILKQNGEELIEAQSRAADLEE